MVQTQLFGSLVTRAALSVNVSILSEEATYSNYLCLVHLSTLQKPRHYNQPAGNSGRFTAIHSR